MRGVARGSVTWEVRDGRAVWDGRLLADWVEPLARELALEFDAVEIVLFGSVARGDDNADSDVDLLVVLDRYDPADAAALKARAVAAAREPRSLSTPRSPTPTDSPAAVGSPEPSNVRRRPRAESFIAVTDPPAERSAHAAGAWLSAAPHPVAAA
ncbi:MAG: nucleotidyltransferase family protein [Acidimicrobiales bacterium]